MHQLMLRRWSWGTSVTWTISDRYECTTDICFAEIVRVSSVFVYMPKFLAGFQRPWRAAGYWIWHQICGDKCQGVNQCRGSLLHTCQRHQGKNGKETGNYCFCLYVRVLVGSYIFCHYYFSFRLRPSVPFFVHRILQQVIHCKRVCLHGSPLSSCP